MSIPLQAQKVIQKLGLKPLEPEGGYFKQTFVSENLTSESASRPAMTAIYYLVTDNNFSAFHRLKSDEIYHFYFGARVELSIIDNYGKLSQVILGGDPTLYTPQQIVEKGFWQACRIMPGELGNWTLLGTTVSPGFDFADFELAKRMELERRFPSLSSLIKSLTRD